MRKMIAKDSPSRATLILWTRLNDAIKSVVDNVTLADLVEWQCSAGDNYSDIVV